MSTDSARPEPAAAWLGGRQAFCVTHPTGGAARVGVVLCSPFGWDEVASYRTRYELAERLAAAGFPTARFDWPGTGDSAGSPADRGRLAAWCDALTDVAAHLRGATGVQAVAAIGFGLGGLIAVEAIRRGAPLDAVALWGAPRDGRAFVRGERAFAGMLDADRGGHDTLLQDGWIQSGGFVVSAEMAADLDRVDLKSGAPGLRRVLLLDRDGITLPPAVIAGLSDSGAQVSETSGRGYGEFVHRPEFAELPETVLTAFRDWLSEVPSGPAATPTDGSPPAAAERMTLPDGSERVVRIALDGCTPFAIVTVPDRPRPGAPTLILLPAWAMRRSGPNRMWTEVARQACEEGFTTVRVDLGGIGDAAGSRDWLRFHDNAADGRIVDEIAQVVDGLAAAGFGERFAACGMSSGGFWAFRSLLENPRIDSAVTINTGAHLLEPAWHAAIVRRKARAAFSPRAWIRLLRDGDLRQTRVFGYLRQRLQPRRGGAGGPGPAPISFLAAVDELPSRGARLTLALTSNEEMRLELQRRGLWDEISRRPGLTIETISGLDHNLRTLGAQRDARRVVLEHMRRISGDAPATGTDPAG